MTIDWPNKVISVPQADLTLVSGTIYTMDTETYFRTELMALADDEQGMAWPVPYQHSTEVTVAGVTYSRVIEIINGYTVQFTPNSQWTVTLQGSNNNIFDVENGVLVQNQVQVIPTNSGGLITVTSGSGLSAAQDTKLSEVHTRLDLETANPNTYADDGSTISNTDFTLTKSDNGNGTFDVDRS